MNQFGLFGGKEIEIVLCYPFQFNMECGGLTLLGVLSWSGPTVVVRVYKGFGNRLGTPIRGQVIDRSHEYAAGNRLKSQVSIR